MPIVAKATGTINLVTTLQPNTYLKE